MIFPCFGCSIYSLDLSMGLFEQKLVYSIADREDEDDRGSGRIAV
jgi:hypothetical protein